MCCRSGNSNFEKNIFQTFFEIMLLHGKKKIKNKQIDLKFAYGCLGMNTVRLKVFLDFPEPGFFPDPTGFYKQNKRHS